MAKAVIVLVALSLLLPAASGAAPRQVGSTKACLHTAQHEHEVCTAYVVNCALISLAPYYVFVRSANPARRKKVVGRLKSRYHDSALTLIRERTAWWPRGENRVGLPDINILSVKVDLSANQAILVTRESWQVTSSKGLDLYREDHQRHVIIMRRVPGLILHKWVVTAFR
ncbi:hypothetical protein KW801_03785 [Candidatus Saccharibacteria bacterium]|nr:hypothetical protein [Candidatus Saccharibacteria bacterium]